MFTSTPINIQEQPLESIILKAKSGQSLSFLKQTALIFASTLLIALAARVQVQLGAIPFTLQSAAVILVGMMLGAKRGFATVILYLFEGFMGAPVFSGGAGGAHLLFHPTIGYLAAFAPAAWLSGYLVERGFGRRFLSVWIASLLSAAIIFAGGYSVLAWMMGAKRAFTVGVLPFIYTEPVKLLILSVMIPHLWRPRSSNTTHNAK